MLNIHGTKKSYPELCSFCHGWPLTVVERGGRLPGLPIAGATVRYIWAHSEPSSSWPFDNAPIWSFHPARIVFNLLVACFAVLGAIVWAMRRVIPGQSAFQWRLRTLLAFPVIVCVLLSSLIPLGLRHLLIATACYATLIGVAAFFGWFIRFGSTKNFRLAMSCTRKTA